MRFDRQFLGAVDDIYLMRPFVGLDLDAVDSYELLQIIGKKRGMLKSGGEIDTERAAVMLLDEFRAAKLGRITVEMPNGVLR